MRAPQFALRNKEESKPDYARNRTRCQGHERGQSRLKVPNPTSCYGGVRDTQRGYEHPLKNPGKCGSNVHDTGLKLLRGGICRH
jgi:hypothetical protein